MARAQFATRNTHSAAHARGRPVQRLAASEGPCTQADQAEIDHELSTMAPGPSFASELEEGHPRGGPGASICASAHVPADVDLHTGLRAMVLSPALPTPSHSLPSRSLGNMMKVTHRLRRCGQLWCLKFGSSRAFGDPFCVSRLSRRGLGPLGRLHVRAAASGRLQHRARKHAKRL